MLNELQIMMKWSVRLEVDFDCDFEAFDFLFVGWGPVLHDIVRDLRVECHL